MIFYPHHYDDMQDQIKEHPSIPTWDQTFMDMAHIIARRSKDPRTKVGCVIVDQDKRIIACGYNGMPLGDDSLPWQAPEKYDYVIHAEMNAILNSTRHCLKGHIAYVTHHPCIHCIGILAQKGIKAVIYKEDGRAKTTGAINLGHRLGLKIYKVQQ